jgi:hypothetical protein
VKLGQREASVRAASLVFPCLLFCALSAQAQDDSSPKLSMIEIRPESAPGVYLEGAAVSPDGEQVSAAFRRVSRGPEIAISVRIWKVGTNEPSASKELSSGEKMSPWELFTRGRRSFVEYCDNGSGLMVAARGTLYYLNPQTLEVLHATATNIEERTPGARILRSEESACRVRRVRRRQLLSGESL